MEQNEEQVVYMNAEQIHDWKPYKDIPAAGQYREPIKARMKKINQWGKAQLAGRRWGIGCVSLEITQRCNLDCTLCYLSDASEAVKDVPLEEIFRRIDMVRAHYGPNTDVQVSGGDPTLRERTELVAIVKRIVDSGMRASLFTNGIKATKDLLTELSGVGLSDVAFHVDLTQERKGYKTEIELNKVREEYIERAKGLPLMIIFNTTVHAGNFHEIPDMVRFFRDQSEFIRFGSFQLQADTGRGVLRERDFVITQETVMEQIRKGAESKINFDVPIVGHPKCNKYSYMFSCNGKLYDIWDDPDFLIEVLDITKDVEFDRQDKMKTVFRVIKTVAGHKHLIIPGLKFLGRNFWRMRWDLLKSGFKVNKLSFFIHNFMDACKLEEERLEGCVFMVATKDGPLSMCMHNAKRDEYILAPVKMKSIEGEKVWNPLTGTLDPIPAGTIFELDPTTLPMKNAKGRVKQVLKEQKEKEIKNA